MQYYIEGILYEPREEVKGIMTFDDTVRLTVYLSKFAHIKTVIEIKSSKEG